MISLLETYYNKETKKIDASLSRSPNSTLLENIDVLSLVYDVYTWKNIQLKNVTLVNLLFLHGSGMNRVIWEYYVANIAKYLINGNSTEWLINKIILLDQVTHGDSYILNEFKLSVNYDWTDGARDACKVATQEFLPHFILEGQITINVVVGHSMGGFQALACGVLMQWLFDLIIPIEPVLLTHNDFKARRSMKIPNRFYQSLWNKMDDKFQSRKEMELFFDKKSFYTKLHPEILKRIKDFECIILPDGSVKTKITQKQNIICYMTLYPTSLWLQKSLQFIKAPVASIVGGMSTWTPSANQEILMKEIPQYHRDTIINGDHLVNIEMPV